jgi:Fur family ferric uptake transcriptional regulator
MNSTAFLRMTNQRRAILHALQKMSFHPAADDVYTKVKHRLPRITLGTVYRTLDSLVEQGVILEVNTPGRRKRFDHKTEPHSHIICTVCGAIEDVLTDASQLAILSDTGFSIAGLDIQFSGECPACRSQRSSASMLEPYQQAN